MIDIFAGASDGPVVEPVRPDEKSAGWCFNVSRLFSGDTDLVESLRDGDAFAATLETGDNETHVRIALANYVFDHLQSIVVPILRLRNGELAELRVEPPDEGILPLAIVDVGSRSVWISSDLATVSGVGEIDRALYADRNNPLREVNQPVALARTLVIASIEQTLRREPLSTGERPAVPVYDAMRYQLGEPEATQLCNELWPEIEIWLGTLVRVVDEPAAA